MEIPNDIKTLRWWVVFLIAVPCFLSGIGVREYLLENSGNYVKKEEYKKLEDANATLKGNLDSLRLNYANLKNEADNLRNNKDATPAQAQRQPATANTMTNKIDNSQDVHNTNIKGNGNTVQ